MLIQVTGPIGFETAKRIYENNRETLDKRFAGFFIRQFFQIEEEGCAAVAAADSLSRDAACLLEIGELGLFGSLWNLGCELNCGLSVKLSDVPVRQEITEVLELFDESPYECPSAGSFLVAAEQELLGCTVIGRTEKGKARIIDEGESARYLTPPSRQQKDIADRKSYRN